MIIILFQRGGNNNASLIQKWCQHSRIPCNVVDVDMYGEESVTWHTQQGPIGSSHVTGVYNATYRDAGMFSTQAISTEYREFARHELHSLLFGSLEQVPHPHWMNHPTALKMADLKLHQLSVAQRIGLDVPETIVSNNCVQLREFWETHHDCGVVTKAIAVDRIASCGTRHTVLYTSRVTESHMTQLPSKPTPPVLFQREIAKKHELRVVVVDDIVFTCRMGKSLHTTVDWRTDKSAVDASQPYTLKDEIATKCVSVVSALGLRFGVLDLIEDVAGDTYFLEVNQQGGWGWMESQLHMPISQTVVEHLCS